MTTICAAAAGGCVCYAERQWTVCDGAAAVTQNASGSCCLCVVRGWIEEEGSKNYGRAVVKSIKIPHDQKVTK